MIHFRAEYDEDLGCWIVACEGERVCSPNIHEITILTKKETQEEAEQLATKLNEVMQQE